MPSHARASERQLSVLVVEDEALVAMNLEMMIEDLGHRVIGPVMRIDRLETVIDAGVQADVAILDVNIGGHEVYPQAERLAAAGIPLVFATGYGRAGIRDVWHSAPVIQKPYTADDIARGLDAALRLRNDENGH